jgi:hypothetical protein
MKLTHDRHHHDGGTFITNFSADCFPIYEEAIRVYGVLSQGACGLPKRTLIVSDIPASPAPRDGSCGSLHYVGDGDFDLSAFWRVFDVVQEVRRAK